jgi:hypothetical protein
MRIRPRGDGEKESERTGKHPLENRGWAPERGESSPEIDPAPSTAEALPAGLTAGFHKGQSMLDVNYFKIGEGFGKDL